MSGITFPNESERYHDAGRPRHGLVSEAHLLRHCKQPLKTPEFFRVTFTTAPPRDG
jgi:hypothetical protein